MNTSFKNILKDFMVYGFGDVLVRASAFFTMPVYTRIFSTTEYGRWSLIVTAMGLLSGVLILGGDSAYARFYFEAKTLRAQQILTSTWFFFLAFWSLGVVLVCLPWARTFSLWAFGSHQYKALFILALFAAPVTLVNTMCGQALRNQFRAKLFTVLNAVSVLLTFFSSVYGAIVLQMGLLGVFGGALVAAVAMLPVRLWAVRHLLKPVFSIEVLWKLLAFGVPLVPVSLAYWIFGVSDRIVLGKLSTFEQVGLYAVANTLAGGIGLFLGALSQAWSPYAIQIYEQQRDKAPFLFGQIFTYILIGFGLLSVGVTTFAYEGLVLLSSPAYYPAAIAIGPLALAFVAYASTQVTSAGISLTKRTQYFTFFSWIAALLNLGFNILFVPKWGMIASSWATTISYVFLTVSYLVVSQKLWAVKYEKRRVFVIIFLTFLFTIIAPIIFDLSFQHNVLLKGGYCLSFIALLALFQALDGREYSIVRKMFDRRRSVGIP